MTTAAALATLCRDAGYDAAAEVLDRACNLRAYVGLPASMGDTRDGREEAIASLQSAFEGEADVIVIERGL